MTTQANRPVDGDDAPSPEFLHAMMEYQIYADVGLTEIPAAKAAMARALEHAPASIKRALAAKAVALGVLPPTSVCLDDGTPVYELNALAAHLGLSAEEVINSGAAIHRGGIHSLQ